MFMSPQNENACRAGDVGPPGESFPPGASRLDSIRTPTTPGMQGRQIRNSAGGREVTHMWTACQVISFSFSMGWERFFTMRNCP